MGIQLMKHHLQSRVNAQILYVYITIILNGRITIILSSNITVENFFAPLQLVCKSFVFFCTLLEFFYNYFVLQWSNVWRHILLITLNNIVKEYKIFEKINLFIHPFAKKLQIWWIKSFQKNCILVQKYCKLEQRKCN